MQCYACVQHVRMGWEGNTQINTLFICELIRIITLVAQQIKPHLVLDIILICLFHTVLP